MKTLFSLTTLFICLTLSFLVSESKAQIPILVAPSDIVVSRNFNFDYAKLKDPATPTFGRIFFDAALRKPIITHDILCSNYCKENLHTGYPNYQVNVPTPKPAPIIACEYYNQLYDNTQPNRQFDLNWGLDGYFNNDSVNDPVINIVDLRLCGQGSILRVFSATKANNQTVRDTQTIWIVDCNYNPPQNLVCQSGLNLNLDSLCSATIDAQLVLIGNGYCYDFYTIELRDWITNAIIDRDNTKPGSQLGIQDVGRTIKYTVTDPTTGEHCSGQIQIRDNTPPKLTCPPDQTISCENNPQPSGTGIAGWKENCSKITLSFSDFVLFGGCEKVYDRIIHRTWTAVDNFTNRSTCLQIIQVNNSKLEDVKFPPNFDDVDQPSLKCHERIDTNFNINPTLAAYPNCVDGFLLDSVYWKAHPGEPDVYPNRRLPRVLGWNSITDPKSIYFAHPNPATIYYPTHKDWNLTDQHCWNANQHVMWMGSGMPSHEGCRNLGYTYSDSIVRSNNPICVQQNPTCYTIYRTWFVLDWCTGTSITKTQKIVIKDLLAPEILIQDTVTAQIESFKCQGRWDVLPTNFKDDCSGYVHFTVESDSGKITGNETMGYSVSDLNLGFHIATVIAEDCCGNISSKQVVIRVIDNFPPNPVCRQNMIVSITGNQAPGNNYAKVFANLMDEGSFDNCGPIFFKIIRSDNLAGTKNGSGSDQGPDNIDCNKFNGDDDTNLDGNQIYFDEFTDFCCEDIGQTLSSVLRVFDLEPGAGPVNPSRMEPGGDLYNHFSDCITLVEVQDKSIPTMVSPPNIVVSCEFQFNLTNLSNPNDSTFGRFVNNLADRNKVLTHDKVCKNFCVKNDTIDYPGYITGAPPSNPPASNRACNYYNSLFDSINPERTYEMQWGFDGYILSACDNQTTITVDDLRKCGQGKIIRNFTATGPNGIQVTATQTIWVVGCESRYPQIQIISTSSNNPNNGSADINLHTYLVNNCYPEGNIKLTYEIDEFNDGIGKYQGYDFEVGPLSLNEFILGIIPQFSDNPGAFYPNNTTDASGRYPFGIHKIRWKAEDDCGNVNYVERLFETKNIVSAINTNNNQHLIITPNPSQGSTLIQSESKMDLIRLISATGQNVQSFSIQNKQSFEISDLTSGVYFVKAYYKGLNVASAKLIIMD